MARAPVQSDVLTVYRQVGETDKVKHALGTAVREFYKARNIHGMTIFYITVRFTGDDPVQTGMWTVKVHTTPRLPHDTWTPG